MTPNFIQKLRKLQCIDLLWNSGKSFWLTFCPKIFCTSFFPKMSFESILSLYADVTSCKKKINSIHWFFSRLNLFLSQFWAPFGFKFQIFILLQLPARNLESSTYWILIIPAKPHFGPLLAEKPQIRFSPKKSFSQF